MVRNLLILNSSINQSRDLWWPRDTKATLGYNVYRAENAPIEWKRLTPTPVPGQYFRDQTRLQLVKFPVTAGNWIDAGEMGQKCVRLPDVPYSNVTQGRAVVASHPDDVGIEIIDNSNNKTILRPLQVSGMDKTVWLPVGAALPYGGAVDEYPIIDYSKVASINLLYYRLVNHVDIMTNLLRTFYTVVPVTDRGEEHLPGARGTDIVDSLQVDKIDYILAEMVRRNQWLLEQAAEPTKLLFRRSSGERCGCASEFTQGRTACPICYETGFVGGYYGPIDFLFLDPDTAATRTIDEGGQKVERQSQSWVTRTPVLQDGDLIVRKNGERLVISGVTPKMPRGVLVHQNYNVELLNPLDTRYLIPIDEPEEPVLYNPVTQHDPGHGAQPVVVTKSENPRAGRTVTFARIQV